MTQKYLAIEIHGEIFVMNDNDELGGLIDKNQMPACICKSPKCKCGTWWKSKAKYVSTLPVKNLGK